MRKIAYEDANGNLCVIHPVINTYPQMENITEDEAFERAKKDIPDGALNVTFLDEADIPLDRSNRSKWKLHAGKIVIGV